jgi:hypothetical protein
MKQPVKIHRDDLLKERVARALPACMFTLVHESLRESGMEVRADLTEFTHRAFQAAVVDLDQLMQNMVATRATIEAQAILRAPSADNLSHLWVSLAHAVLKAQQRGVQFDSNVLLIAGAIETEIAFDAADYGGMPMIERTADRLDNEALARGWWGPPQGVLVH